MSIRNEINTIALRQQNLEWLLEQRHTLNLSKGEWVAAYKHGEFCVASSREEAYEKAVEQDARSDEIVFFRRSTYTQLFR